MRRRGPVQVEQAMLRALGVFAAVTAAVALWAAVAAAELATRDDAVAMVKRVQEKFRKDGPQATFAAVASKRREFHDRDLYAFVVDFNGVSITNGGTPEVIGKNILDFRDQDGKFLVREMIDVAKGPGRGWVDYRWMNPKTRTIESKSAYIERMGDYLVGAGVYRSQQVNDNTVGIISGSPSSDDTYLQMAYDLASVLNDGENLRILPIVGIGGPQNIRDVRDQRGIDVGLTQTAVLNNFRRSNEQLGGTDDKIVYIAKLFNEEAHFLARSDITSIEELRGRKVNLDENGSGTSYAARDVFKRLNIKVEEVALTQVEALDKLRSGEIAATVLVAGKPARSLARLNGADGLHFLPVPYSTSLGADYLPATLGHDDYPDMIPPGESVDTVAVGAVLITSAAPKNSDRYRRVEKFVNAFFPRIGEFQRSPHHVKWREVNLAATLPGFARFGPAEEWLNASRVRATPDDQQRSEFKTFLATRANSQPRGAGDTPEQSDQLYQQFLLWSRSREGR